MAEQNTECNECPRDYLADSGMLTWPEQITDKICHWKKCHPEKRRRDNARLHDIVLARFHHCCVRGILRYSTLTVMDEMNADNLACRTMCQLILLDQHQHQIQYMDREWVLVISKWSKSISGQI